MSVKWKSTIFRSRDLIQPTFFMYMCWPYKVISGQVQLKKSLHRRCSKSTNHYKSNARPPVWPCSLSHTRLFSFSLFTDTPYSLAILHLVAFTFTRKLDLFILNMPSEKCKMMRQVFFGSFSAVAPYRMYTLSHINKNSSCKERTCCVPTWSNQLYLSFSHSHRRPDVSNGPSSSKQSITVHPMWSWCGFGGSTISSQCSGTSTTRTS